MAEKLMARVNQGEKSALAAWVVANQHRRIAGQRVTESSTIRGLVRVLLGFDGLFSSDEINTLRETNRLLSNLTGNLNQLAKAYNQGLLTRPVDTADFFGELQQLIHQLQENHRGLVLQVQQKRTVMLSSLFENEE